MDAICVIARRKCFFNHLYKITLNFRQLMIFRFGEPGWVCVQIIVLIIWKVIQNPVTSPLDSKVYLQLKYKHILWFSLLLFRLSTFIQDSFSNFITTWYFKSHRTSAIARFCLLHFSFIKHVLFSWIVCNWLVNNMSSFLQINIILCKWNFYKAYYS